jgi:hypothetical protein
MTDRVQSPEQDERFHGLLGAWDRPDEDLPYVMRAFANAMPVAYRGWAEVIRAWAYRLEREEGP